jgi:hypothetical protein
VRPQHLVCPVLYADIIWESTMKDMLLKLCKTEPVLNRKLGVTQSSSGPEPN